MPRSFIGPFCGLILLCAHTGLAAGAVPSPTNSSLPACMAFCPLGDMPFTPRGDIPFTVVVRDFANNPINGSSVVLDFSTCSGAYLCASLPSDPYVVDLAARTLRMTTGANGSVTFPARVGGVGPANSVSVYADGVLLKQYALASPDQDGDGYVVSIIGADDPTFAAKLGSNDPTADFDCSGTVDAADQQNFFFHHSHSCLGFVDPTRRSTWGSLKLHYR